MISFPFSSQTPTDLDNVHRPCLFHFGRRSRNPAIDRFPLDPSCADPSNLSTLHDHRSPCPFDNRPLPPLPTNHRPPKLCRTKSLRSRSPRPRRLRPRPTLGPRGSRPRLPPCRPPPKRRMYRTLHPDETSRSLADLCLPSTSRPRRRMEEGRRRVH